ncbi:MAG: hypothetical protein WAK60_00675 [Sedimentisphaerales bacterium]
MKIKPVYQQILFGVVLVSLSVFFYVLHYIIFRDAHQIFLYLLSDIAFVFIEVLLVTLIIRQLLSAREKRAMLKKLNMVIGAFFSEAGISLLKYFWAFDAEAESLGKHLIVDSEWSEEHFNKIRAILQHRDSKIYVHKGKLEEMRSFLINKRSFLLGLLENPNLLEHDEFTELLWAVFHLAEELSHRESVRNLPETDYEHLAGDIKRAYGLLVREWLSYMEHLKGNYPYLFSLAVRTNPFNPQASVEVK